MNTYAHLLEENATIIIGSDPSNAVVLPSENVSKRHCQITKIATEKYLIVDLGSETGTFVNNERIATKEISTSDFLQVGDTIFQLRSTIIHAKAKRDKPNPEASSPPAPKTEEPIVAKTENSAEKPDQNENPLLIYCLYAPEDEGAAKFLDKHLTVLRYNKNRPVEIQGAFKRLPGEDKSVDEAHLNKADIILVFLSVNIMDDDTYKRSMLALDYYNKGRTKLIPILTRRCLWNQMPFSKLPLLPKNLQPLYSKSGWDSEDDAFTNVVEDIGKTVNAYYEQKEKQPAKATAPQRPQQQLQVDFKSSFNWSLFGKRMGAYILDFVILGMPLIFVLMALGIPIENYDGTVPLGVTVFLLLFLTFASAFFESKQKMATPGKMIFGLIITDVNGDQLSFGESLKRNAVKYIIILFMQDITLNIVTIIAQLAYYAIKGKFIHDEISKTAISPSAKKAESFATSRGF